MRDQRFSDAERAALLACQGPDGWTPDGIVEAAQDADNALHHRFTWDDAVAGRLHRLQEAREIIHLANIEVTVETKTFHVPMLVHDPAAQGQCYRSTQQLADDDPETATRVLIYTLTTARGHLARAQALATIFRLDGSLADLLVRLDGIVADLRREDDDEGGEVVQPVLPEATI